LRIDVIPFLAYHYHRFVGRIVRRRRRLLLDQTTVEVDFTLGLGSPLYNLAK